jgi:DNA-binding CsgD family transcriptional regulator
MLRYCGYDLSERQIGSRSPASRFTPQQVETMRLMAKGGSSSLEIAAELDLKPQSIRAKLNSMGIRLRRRVARLNVRLVVPVTKAMAAAADQRGIGVAALIRRLIAVISRDDLFDDLLPIPRAHSLGAAAAGESEPPVVIIRSPQFAVVL